MKRSISILIVYVLIFLFPLNTLAVGSNTVTYSTEEVFDNVRVTIQYSIVDSVIYETSNVYENNVFVLSLIRTAYPNGRYTVTKNGATIYSGITDYDSFYRLAHGENQYIATNSNQNTRETYFPCGYSTPHTHVDTLYSTINLSTYYALSDLAAAIIAIKLGGSGIGWEIAYNFASRLKQLDADYVDITQYKYFMQDYSLNTAYNCYHTYYTAYDVSAAGVRENLDAWNCFYQEIL